jgi:hypothetical protein
MSGTFLTGEKKIRDTMASLLLSEKAPRDWGLYPELVTMMDKRGILQRMLKWDSRTPIQNPALSAKVTTRGLSAPIPKWKARCHLLWINGSWPPVRAPLLGINVEPWGSPSGRKAKGHFLARQWSSFLCLTFLSGSPVQ